MRATACLLAVLVVAALSSCVYYNTFYHARAAAREAELLREARPPDSEPGVREVELLERVIEKCGRVLKLHADSEWADDALLLMGSALYHQGKYESAESRITGFLSLYPESELRPEAEYMLAAILLANDNPTAAEDIVKDLAYADPPGPLSDDALVLIGGARRARGRYAEAAEAYLDALSRFPKSDRRTEIHFLAAENYITMGRLEEAAAHFAAVAEEGGVRQLAFEARIRLAEVEIDLGDAQAALEVLDELSGRTTDRDELDRILLLSGRAHEATGDFDEAISTYEEVVASHDKSTAAGEACYRIGLIERDHRRSLEDAAAAFERVSRQAPRSDVAELARDAISAIETLQGYLEVIAAHEAGRPAELEAARPSSLSSAEPAATPEEAPVDSLALATADTGAAAPRYDALIGPPAPDQEPEPADDPDAQVAMARLRAAELYLLEFGDAATALAHYETVLELHPASAAAPKAAFAIGWILEHEMDDAEGALRAYLAVIERFPDTEYSAGAMEARARLMNDGGATQE